MKYFCLTQLILAISLFLAEKAEGQTIQSFSICEGDSVAVGTSVYYDGGTFVDVLVDVDGVDSIVVTNLEVVNLVYELQISAGGFQYVGNFNSFQWLNCANGFEAISPPNQSGFYAFQLTNNGCSVIADCIYLAVNNEVVCPGKPFVVGNNVYTLPGTFVNYFQTADGIDSIVRSNIFTYSSPLVQYSTDGTSIFASTEENWLLEFWYDCASFELITEGSNGGMFTPSYSGSFTIGGANHCPDFTNCFEFKILGTDELQKEHLMEVYPNPFENEIHLKLENFAVIEKIEIINAIGENLQTIFPSENEISVHLHAAHGVYFVQSRFKNGSSITKKIIKQ